MVRYHGATHFAAGDFLGVELFNGALRSENTGTDGTVDGVVYFDTAGMNAAIFVPDTAVAVLQLPHGAAAVPPTPGPPGPVDSAGASATGASAGTPGAQAVGGAHFGSPPVLRAIRGQRGNTPPQRARGGVSLLAGSPMPSHNSHRARAEASRTADRSAEKAFNRSHGVQSQRRTSVGDGFLKKFQGNGGAVTPGAAAAVSHKPRAVSVDTPPRSLRRGGSTGRSRSAVGKGGREATGGGSSVRKGAAGMYTSSQPRDSGRQAAVNAAHPRPDRDAA